MTDAPKPDAMLEAGRAAVRKPRMHVSHGASDDCAKSGGAAFPVLSSILGHETGMSLRDWFAGHVAIGMASYSGTQGLNFGPCEIASRSYEVADAMLAARESRDD